MSSIKILHAADLHLDSPFEALSAGKAAVRRSEQRELLTKLSELARGEAVDLVLLSGDLLDSENTYFETGEELVRSLQSMAVPVFIAPGNHDFYSGHSAYARYTLPENVYVFKGAMECVELKELGVKVYGAGFTDKYSPSLLEDFHAEEDGSVSLMCIHGEVGVRESAYNPISEAQISQSGLDYLALGHVHKASGLKKAGSTWYSWPGCPEGRGFDETGDRFINIVELSDGDCTLRQEKIFKRKYEILRVDITGSDALLAVHTQLPDDTVRDVYRIVLSGDTDSTPDLQRLQQNLSEFFFELQLKDETRLRCDLWEGVGEDSLRGLFLAKLKKRLDASRDGDERRAIEAAARWGLAALDNREELVRHED